jgi:hypothetical protein
VTGSKVRPYCTILQNAGSFIGSIAKIAIIAGIAGFENQKQVHEGTRRQFEER